MSALAELTDRLSSANPYAIESVVADSIEMIMAALVEIGGVVAVPGLFASTQGSTYRQPEYQPSHPEIRQVYVITV